LGYLRAFRVETSPRCCLLAFAEDDDEDVPAIMIPTTERLQNLADFSVKYAQQGIDWEAVSCDSSS
jgi:hypothetical protein